MDGFGLRASAETAGDDVAAVDSFDAFYRGQAVRACRLAFVLVRDLETADDPCRTPSLRSSTAS